MSLIPGDENDGSSDSEKEKTMNPNLNQVFLYSYLDLSSSQIIQKDSTLMIPLCEKQ